MHLLLEKFDAPSIVQWYECLTNTCKGFRIALVPFNAIQFQRRQEGLCIPGLGFNRYNDMASALCLVDVCPCTPFTISLATSNGGQFHMNICKHCGHIPLPLVNGATYYQTCFVNPYASETLISPQAIWQLAGYSQGRPIILSIYSPLGLLKMSIELSQHDGLYYSTTDTFTIDTNPWS